MNFLAHLYLSGTAENVRFGNFIGDHIKGRAYMRYRQGIRRGVMLHRFIDHYTDHHPIVARSKDRLRPAYGRYAGIAVDVLYDHYLSANWADYHHLPLHSFARKVYFMLLRKYFHLPPQAKQYVPFMIANNWLALYGKPGGVRRVLTGMSTYSSLPPRAIEAEAIIRAHYALFYEEFRAFMPQIAKAIQEEKGIPVPEKLGKEA